MQKGQTPFSLHETGQALIFLLIGILITAVAGGAFYLGRSTTPKSSTITLQPTPTPDASREPTGSAETANWKMYTTTEIYLKHPPNLKYTTRVDKAVGNGSVNVDEWSGPNPSYTFSIHSYLDGVEPITRIIGEISKDTIIVAGQTVQKATPKSGQPLIHVGPIKHNSKNYLIVFVTSSSSNTQYQDIEIFNKILSTFKFTN